MILVEQGFYDKFNVRMIDKVIDQDYLTSGKKDQIYVVTGKGENVEKAVKALHEILKEYTCAIESLPSKLTSK
jgi:hypothetical protein